LLDIFVHIKCRPEPLFGPNLPTNGQHNYVNQ